MDQDTVRQNLYIRDFKRFMNNYKIQDINVGLKESFEVNITEAMMESFRNITGDNNPLHTDSDFAKERNYPDRIVYGLLTSSFLSTLAGVYLPGENSLIREVDTKYVKPVFVGDTLTVTGEVSEVNADFNIFTMKVTIVNQKGEKVVRGKMQMGVLG